MNINYIFNKTIKITKWNI